MLLATASCQTTKSRLPSDLRLPVLDEQNIEATAVSLLVQHYRWMEWANESRYLCGEITEAERDKRLKEILDILHDMEYTE